MDFDKLVEFWSGQKNLLRMFVMSKTFKKSKKQEKKNQNKKGKKS